MTLRLTLAVLGLAVLLVVLYQALGERGAGTARSGEARSARSEDAAPPLAREPVTGPEVAPAEEATARRVAAPSPEASPRPEVPLALSAPGHHLRGVVLHATDRRPAADAALVLWCGEEYQEVFTGKDGRFETVVPSGAVRVWHKGNLPGPTLAEHLELRPETLLLAEPPFGGDFEPVELLLVDPAAWVEVEVVDGRGVPTTAELRWLFRPPVGPGSGMRAPTDSRGRARIAFPSLDPGSTLLLAARTEEQTSEVARIEAPPPDERTRLVLDTGGNLRIRVLESDGAPRSGQRLRLETPDAGHRLFDLQAETDGQGLGVFLGVPPGLHVARFYDETRADWVRASVAVERGLTTDLELRVPALPVAAAGRVVDAQDRPVAHVTVVARIGGKENSTATDASGAFSFGAAPGGKVLLSVEKGLQEDRFEPPSLEVPFGTRDAVFRAVETRPTRTLALEILEPGATRRIPRSMVLGFVEPERGSWSFHPARDGLVTLGLKLYDDVTFSIEAVGYRRRIVRAVDLARDLPEGEPARVVLEPGLERWLLVLDEDTGEPLVDARILDGERQVALADGEGRALIELAEWPLELRVRANGHEERTWTCKEWLSELGDGAIGLPRSSPPAEPR